MPNIKPISELRNYTSVLNEVTYGNRVYLTKNGYGQCVIIDMQELDELDKLNAMHKLVAKLNKAEESVREEGTISSDALELELGVQHLKKIEYSMIVRKKLNLLRQELSDKFGDYVSRKSVKKITDAVKGLVDFEKKGVLLSNMYDIDCDYRYLFVGQNYLFYRIEDKRILIVEMFNEREDFIQKLFGTGETLHENLFKYYTQCQKQVFK